MFIIFEQQTERQKILHRIIVNIPWLQSALYFLLKRIFIRQGCSLMFDLFHLFEGILVTFSCIIISIHDHVLSFIGIFFNKITFLASTKSSVFFFL
jgi:hypothetical protein